MCSDDDFVVFENNNTGIGSKLLKKMGYEGKGLGINCQGIVNAIKVDELPHQAGLRYVLGESVERASEPPTTYDEKPSSILSNLTVEVKNVDLLLVSSSHSMICV